MRPLRPPSRTRPMLRRPFHPSRIKQARAGARAGAVALALLLMPLAGAQAQAPNPQMAAAQASFEALPEAERKAIQTDLIWAGQFNGAVSGSFGPLTFRAINSFKGARGQPDGVLPPT